MPTDALQALFPGLTEEELQLTAESLDQYLALAWEIMQEAERPLGES